MERNSDPLAGVGGTFYFRSPGTDINGRISALTNDAVFIDCEYHNNPCLGGSELRVLDAYIGLNPFRQGPDPVFVHGILYPVVYYRGGMTIDGGTITIPNYLARLRTFQITVPSRIRASLGVYPLPVFNRPMFVFNTELEGTTTMYFRKVGIGPNARNDTYKIVHNFPPPTSPQ